MLRSVMFAALATIVTAPWAAVQPLNAAGASYMRPMYDILSKNCGAYDKTFSVDDHGTGVEDAIDRIEKNAAYFAVLDDVPNWPILLPVYLVLKQTSMDDEKAKKLLRFFYWNFHNSGRAIKYWGLVPFSSSFQAKAIRIVRKVQSMAGTRLQPEFVYELAQ